MIDTYLSDLGHQVKILQEHLPAGFFEKCLQFESIFHLHIPKTGGTFLNEALNRYWHLNFMSTRHGTCSSLRLFPDPTDALWGKESLNYLDCDNYADALKICVIRNPYDWLVSFYAHGTTAGNIYIPGALKGVGSLRKLYQSFEEFVFAYSDDEAFWPPGFIGFKNFMPFQIFDDDGNCQADLCLRNEFLSLAIYSLLIGFGIDHRVAKQIFAQERIGKSESRRGDDYRTHYTDKMVTRLEKKFERENQALGYDFEKHVLDESYIIELKNVKYIPITDKMWTLSA